MAGIEKNDQKELTSPDPAGEVQEADAKIEQAAPATGTGDSSAFAGSDNAQLKNEIKAGGETEALAADAKVGQAGETQIITPDSEIHIEELQPNTVYQKNGYEFRTDDTGRVKGVSGELKLEQGTRSPEQTKIGKMGAENDEGGHLIGTRFDGPSDAFNIVPQDAHLNRGDWKEMENEWAKHLENGEKVEVMVEPVYNSDSIRPERFDVVYQVDGQIYQKSFPNQA